uniref:Uncharacterized protein n=1 Tax=Heliothis virescens TaxID=7102 RepID=A0A2A4JEL3_HELVI
MVGTVRMDKREVPLSFREAYHTRLNISVIQDQVARATSRVALVVVILGQAEDILEVGKEGRNWSRSILPTINQEIGHIQARRDRNVLPPNEQSVNEEEALFHEIDKKEFRWEEMDGCQMEEPNTFAPCREFVDPYDAFRSYWDDSIISHIVDENQQMVWKTIYLDSDDDSVPYFHELCHDFEIDDDVEERTERVATVSVLESTYPISRNSRLSIRSRVHSTLQSQQTEGQLQKNEENKEADPAWKKNPHMTVKQQAPKLQKKSPLEDKKLLPVTTELLKAAEELLMWSSQEDSSNAEIENLNSGKPISKENRLHQLSVESVNGVLRLRSRIRAVQDMTEQFKNPLVIDGDHPTVKRWVQAVHRQLHHAGVEATVIECRQ